MNPDYYPSVTVVAGEVRHIVGVTGHMLRMHDGSIYVHMTPEVAAQWLPIIESIANEGIKA